MNHYAARELQKDGKGIGKWHYTCHNKRVGTYAVGPCAENCPGHDTPEGACEHFRSGLLAKAEFKGPKTEEWPKAKCTVAGCESEAKHLISIPGGSFYNWEVCERHADRPTLNILLPTVGESWSSY